MVDEAMNVKILELTFSPDCIRAVDYYPEFYSDIFEVFFFGEEKESLRRIDWVDVSI